MRKFIIETIYESDDTYFDRDFLNMELTDENGEFIMDGDCYHDKIKDKIHGFFKCLDYLGIEYEKEEFEKNEGNW